MKKTFFSYLFYNKQLIIAIALLIMLASIIAQITPYIQGLIVDEAILSANQNALFNLCIIFSVILILDCFTKYYLNIVSINSGYKISTVIRKDIFKQIMQKPYDFFEINTYGDILYKTNMYIYEIGSFVSKEIGNMFIGFTRFLIILTFVFVLNLKVGLILLTLYILVCLTIFLFAKTILKKAKNFKAGELHRNSLILQNIDGMETFLAYNTKFSNLKNYSKVNKGYGNVRNDFYKTNHRFTPLIEAMVSLGTIVVYLFALKSSLTLLDVGIVVSLLTYTSRMIAPMQSVAKGLAGLFETSTTVDEVFKYTAGEKPSIKQEINFKSVNIECKDLTYKNENNNTNIINLNLKIPAKQKLLIVGKYGLGKTSLTNLLCGLYKANSGKILFNGVDINEVSQECLSAHISVTADNVGVFNSTIEQNIKFVKPLATKKEVIKAIKLSGLERLINKLENGVLTKIFANAISEGDKQLLSFARIILKNTPVIIVDEALRDMEEKSKKRFLKTLQEFTKDKTLIFISETENVDFPFEKIIYFKNINKV